MKKVVAMLLAIALTAAVSIGATLAYLTDTDEDVNVMTLGKVKIDQLEYERVDTETENEDATVQEFHDNKPLLPSVVEDNFNWTTGDSYVNWDQIGSEGSDEIWDPANINNEVDKMVFIKNKGDYDAYVRSVIAFEAGNYTTLDEFLKMVHLNINTEDYTWEWVEAPTTIGEGKYFVAVATYKDILQPGKLTPPSLLQIALDPSATNEDVASFGDTYQVLVKSQGIQAQGFEDAETALNEGFGDIPTGEGSIPWENDSPIKGIDLRTALHYENGNGTKITSKVTNVVFALNSEYPGIVNSNKGTLVDIEQDVPVYAYYVNDGSTYTVYFLASDDIYLPRNSKELFMSMSSLKEVDTHNLNTSRAVDMTDTFYNCKKLEKIDVSHWNLGKVEQMYGTFCECRVLGELDVSGWDVSNVVNMRALFSGCWAIKSFDVTDWDTSKVTNMRNLFNKCYALEEITGIGNLDTSSVTDLEQAFADCGSLTKLDVGSWDVSSVEDMSHTFRGCEALTGLDIGGWDIGKVREFNSMFASKGSNTGAMKLVDLDLSDWDMSSATNISYMFYGCGSLKTMDMSNWDVSHVTTTYHMFADCYDLESLDFTGWNTTSLTNMDGMFNDCHELTVLDLSDFDTANVTDISQIFEGCNSLIEIIGFGQWDTSSLVDAAQLFNANGTNMQIEVVDLSGWNTSKVTAFDLTFNGCANLKTIYVGDGWDVDQVTESGSMFSGCYSLVGGNGTTFDSTKTDITYAHVDAEGVPGYLTHISDK